MPMVEIKPGNYIAEAMTFNACLFVSNRFAIVGVGSFKGICAPGPNGYCVWVPLD